MEGIIFCRVEGRYLFIYVCPLALFTTKRKKKREGGGGIPVLNIDLKIC